MEMNFNAFNGMGQPRESTFGVNENTAAVLTLAGTGVLLLVPKLCWLAWILPLVVLIVERQSFYVKKCAAHGLAATLVAMAFMALCSTLFVVSGTMTAGNLITVLTQSGDKSDWPAIIGALLLTVTGILFILIVRIVFVVFLGIAAYKAWQYGYINIPIASALVRKINKNYV